MDIKQELGIKDKRPERFLNVPALKILNQKTIFAVPIKQGNKQ